MYKKSLQIVIFEVIFIYVFIDLFVKFCQL